jgi:hypothetical protein
VRACRQRLMLRRFRAHGLAVEALVEPPLPPGVVSPFYPGATAWAQRWPAAPTESAP